MLKISVNRHKVAPYCEIVLTNRSSIFYTSCTIYFKQLL